MKILRICIFTAFLVFGCEKFKPSEKSNEKFDGIDIVLAQFSKITNQFNIAEINSQKNFDLFALNHSIPCVVLFYSDESVPCVYAKKTFAELSEKSINDILFAQVNLSDKACKSLETKYNILSVPTFLLFKNGKQADRFIGKINIEKLNSFIKK